MKGERARKKEAIPTFLMAGLATSLLFFIGVYFYTSTNPEAKKTTALTLQTNPGTRFSSHPASNQKKEGVNLKRATQEKISLWDEASIQSLALLEVKKLLKELAKWPPSAETERVERWLVKRWATLEPRGACDYAYAGVLRGADTYLLENPLRIWANAFPSQASSWAASLASPSLRDFAIRVAFKIWADKDPSAAAEAAAKLNSATARTSAMVAVAPPQARKDFSAAIKWARELPGATRQKTIEEILGEWTKRDPAKAATWLIQQPGDVQWSLIAKLAADWVRKDPATALAWGQGNTFGLQVGSEMAAGPVQRKFMEAALANLIGADPEAASVWLNSPAGEPYLEFRAAPLAARWASLDPMGATTWSLNLPDPRTREAALQAVIGTWSRIDPQEAGSWILSLPAGRDGDLAVKAYCAAIAPYDGPAAATWANQIGDIGLREAAISSVFKHWEKVDNSAARNFILQNTQLSPEAQQRILR